MAEIYLGTPAASHGCHAEPQRRPVAWASRCFAAAQHDTMRQLTRIRADIGVSQDSLDIRSALSSFM